MQAATLGLFILGLALLTFGADLLVRGASRLATAFGISPLVVGLTVVAYGTSAPELAVSLKAALGGDADLALGNVVGSNIFNVLFILGGSALIAPLVVHRQLVRLDVPLMIGASLLVYAMAWSGHIERFEGAVLMLMAVAYTLFTIRQSRGEPPAVRDTFEKKLTPDRNHLLRDLGLASAGLALLVVGARVLVNAAVSFAHTLGVSELVIGLTIVAAGTSLPEVATSFMAAARGEREIAVGNVIGSNIFNLVAVLGCSALVSPSGVAVQRGALAFDIPVMVAAAVACLPVFAARHLIARWEGALFLAYYVAYTLYVVLHSQQHDALPLFSQVMGLFVLPLTAVTLALLGARAWRAPRLGAAA
jgi:cation:H+ antiporter